MQKEMNSYILVIKNRDSLMHVSFRPEWLLILPCNDCDQVNSFNLNITTNCATKSFSLVTPRRYKMQQAVFESRDAFVCVTYRDWRWPLMQSVHTPEHLHTVPAVAATLLAYCTISADNVHCLSLLQSGGLGPDTHTHLSNFTIHQNSVIILYNQGLVIHAIHV